VKLTRNLTDDGTCKYALVRLDKLRKLPPEQAHIASDALKILAEAGVLEYGAKGDREEFFVLKLKDAFAPSALRALKQEAALFASGESIMGREKDARRWLEYAWEINQLVLRAMNHPERKLPDTDQPACDHKWEPCTSPGKEVSEARCIKCGYLPSADRSMHIGRNTKVSDKCTRIHPITEECPTIYASPEVQS
jgi:hypothetical protein